jgi:hypothetical protein
MGRPTRVRDTETIISLQPLSTRMPGMRQHRTGCLSHGSARVTTLQGHFCLQLSVRRCHLESCPRYHQPYRPESVNSSLCFPSKR